MICRTTYLFFLFALLVPSSAAVQQSALGMDFHKGRRTALMELAGDDLLLFRGLPRPAGHGPFQQDDLFWYLTGLDTPGAALVLDAQTGREILFLPPPSPAREAREGPILDAADPWVLEKSGFEDVRAYDPETNVQLLIVLRDLLDGRERIGVALYPTILPGISSGLALSHRRRVLHDTLDGRDTRAHALADRLEERLEVDVFDTTPFLQELRHVKDAAEVDSLERAGAAAAAGLREALRSTRPGVAPAELRAVVELAQIRAGASGAAIPARLVSGAAACFLDRRQAGSPLAEGALVLGTTGAEVDHYASLLARTWPVDGTFTAAQAELYDAVLAAQAAGIAAAKPGATLVDIDAACTRVLREHELFAHRRHFAVHFVGLEPIDPGLRRELEPGVVLCIGPGAYDRERGMAVRIADLVVITEEGARVLTDAAPRERAEVEALVASEGVLDLLGESRD